tara:strand:+ start:281 stop:556 length:276 start_codon:yes stop_codon:yes gene_type:complete
VYNKNLTKIDIIKDLSNKTGFSKNYSKKIVDSLVKYLILNIKSGSFSLKNVGKFNIIYKKQRIGRNPKTKKEFIISARNSISFTPSKNIKN